MYFAFSYYTKCFEYSPKKINVFLFFLNDQINKNLNDSLRFMLKKGFPYLKFNIR